MAVQHADDPAPFPSGADKAFSRLVEDAIWRYVDAREDRRGWRHFVGDAARRALLDRDADPRRGSRH